MPMSDVDHLFAEFVAQDRAHGPADPSPYLERAAGADRAELEALVDGYLARAPRRPFDAEGFAASRARGVAEELARSLGGAGGTWPALLPRLRHRARLRRADVVRRLAAELDAADHEEKVARYYHEMEQGTLPAAGVSDRVLEALARVTGESAERLRAAGRGGAGAGQAQAATAFARVATPGPRYAEPAPAAPPPAAERDEIDELFTGASGTGG
jgi:hypothetical protein